jgi:tetratricopeptide (TPR) repeat protein
MHIRRLIQRYDNRPAGDSIVTVSTLPNQPPPDPEETMAAQALRLVTADPRRAVQVATQARDAARREADRGAESTAERALGLAARELGDADRALRHLRSAVRVAGAAGLAEYAAEARMSLALVLAEAGRPVPALREIDAAAPALRGLPAARLHMQRALILDRLNRFAEAMQGYTAALAVFRRNRDRLWQARALTNRGVLHAYRGSLRNADADLRAAEQLYHDLGQDLAVAQVQHNLGFVLAQAGDIPGALRWYDRADEYFARTTRPAIALMDRGELLLRARLLPEARAAAQAALTAAQASRMGLFVAQARLLLAEAALAGGDAATAQLQARAAGRVFVRQGRPAWAALARYVALCAGPRLRTGADLRRARQVAGELAASSWLAPALDARLYAARLTLHQPSTDPSPSASTVDGRSREDRRHREDLVAELREVRAAGRHGPAQVRARAWHAEALLREAAGDLAGARRALLAGIRVVEQYQAALGATELRALASGYAADLADTGLRLAARGGRARSLLWWAERCRAAALRLPATRPPDEPALAADLAQLRRVVAEVEREVADAAAPGSSGPGPSVAALRREQRVLEERIRRRSWRATAGHASTSGDAGTSGHGSTSGHGDTSGHGKAENDANGALLDGLSERLGNRCLVELVDVAGTLHGVVARTGTIRSQVLGPVDRVVAELDSLRFGLRRIVRAHGDRAARTAMAGIARHAAGHLDELIFGRLRHLIGDVKPSDDRPADGELVLVPVGVLHATPWALLPTCRTRPVTVAPSAAAWLAAAGARRPPAGPALLVAGPGLAHAEAEVRSVAAAAKGAEVLVGEQASAETVLKALDGTGLAHIAAHGHFRADNPMFSYLRLADGPLTVYDLERLASAPSTVVLSACNAGLSLVHAGEELMGLVAALLGLGTATVLGSVLPAEDSAAEELMVEVHRQLAAGAGPARALASAQAAMGDELDERTATAAAFVCFGAG